MMSGKSLRDRVDVWCASIDLIVDTAVSLLDLEETIHAPAGSPRVGGEPVLNTVFDTETEEFNGVATGNTSGYVLVNA